MAGFDDLVAAALPYLATETIYATAGTTWSIPYDLEDDSGSPVNLTTGFTATWNLYDKDGVAQISVDDMSVSKTTTGVQITVDPEGTDDLDKGTYFHELQIVRNSDGKTLIVVGAEDSKVIVKKKAAA